MMSGHFWNTFSAMSMNTYGYDFHYYKGEPVDEEWVTKKMSRFTTLDRFISRSWESLYRNAHNQKTGAPLENQEEIEQAYCRIALLRPGCQPAARIADFPAAGPAFYQ